MSYLPQVFGYLRPYRKLAVVSVCLILLGTFFGLLAPWPLKILIDNVLENQPLPPWLDQLTGDVGQHRFGLLIAAVLAGFGIILLQNAVTVVDNYVNTRIQESMVLDFRSDLFQHAQRLSMAFHDQRRSGKLINAINNQGDAVARVVMTVPPLAQSVLTLVGMFWITYTMDPKLAVLSLTVVPFLYYSVGSYMKRIHTRLREVKGMEAESLAIIYESVSMLKVIVAFGRESHEFSRFRSQGEQAVDARVKLTVRQTLFSLAVNTTTAAGTALVLGFGAYSVIEGNLTVGELLVVMAYIAAVYQPLEAISTTCLSLQETAVSLKIAFDLLETEADIRDQPGAKEISRARGQIQFEDVSFSYQGRVDTLSHISFTAEAGQVIAVVGPTGAGKTTLISLLPRFYEAVDGRILLDGIDIKDITLRSLRDQISIVLQEPLLFSGSIADNILYGRLDATMDEIVEAARAANAHEFIMRLPEQYETRLGERGAKLSGGERQRISVARAFLKDSPILILDEPTSSIDSKTEAVILDALDRLMIGRTTFMIAHRLSTVRHADKILVLSHGEIAEQGSHEELLHGGTLYKQLHEMQNGQHRGGRRLLETIKEPAP